MALARNRCCARHFIEAWKTFIGPGPKGDSTSSAHGGAGDDIAGEGGASGNADVGSARTMFGTRPGRPFSIPTIELWSVTANAVATKLGDLGPLPAPIEQIGYGSKLLGSDELFDWGYETDGDFNDVIIRRSITSRAPSSTPKPANRAYAL